jgi:hypothetical protein
MPHQELSTLPALLRALGLAMLVTFGGASGAAAQYSESNIPQANPLQPRTVRPAPAAQPAATAPAAQPARREAPRPAARSTAAEPTGEARPARQRSAAQLANDDRMRKCGAEWRANKDQLSARGQTWRTFNVECRARLKAAGQ